jgi:hypothetical protein
LGQLLINFGHIDEEQLAKAFRTQEETKIRLGRVLEMVGLVAPETIRETLAIKVRETVLDAFVWDSGVFRVDDAPPPPPDELDARVPLDEIAREAEFRTTAWEAFRAPFPTGTATLVVHEDDARRELTPGIDARLLALAREGKTIDELALALHLTDFHLYQRLYALKQAGVVEAAAPAEPRPADHVAQARALVVEARLAIDGGNLAGAEQLAARAVEVAPALEGATVLLGDVRKRLREQLRGELLDRPRRPRLKVPAHDVALMRLPAADKYLLARCDGTRDLSQILELAPIAELEVLKSVKRFLAGRIVELA